mgnify:FL=1
MIEIRGDKKVLITPVSAEDLKDIHIGDIVWLDGDLMTCRDVAHRRLVEYGRELPYNIKDKAISMPARSYGKLREQKMITRWFLSDRLLPCVWRNSSMNLQN